MLWGTNNAPHLEEGATSTIADVPLEPNRVDCYKPMTIRWQYSHTNKLEFLDAGVSTNCVYVTWRAPATEEIFHTVADVACRNAAGKTSESAVINGVWTDFEGPVPGIMTWNLLEMKYWPNGWGTPGYFSAADLIKNRSGRCGAWQDFFGAALAVQGITSQALGVYPNHSVPVPQGPVGYVLVEALGMAFTGSASHPGQGNAQAAVTWTDLLEDNLSPGLPIDWGDHGLRFREAQGSWSIYDSSYGTAFGSEILDSAKLAWEEFSVAGFSWMWVNPGNGDVYRDFRPYSEGRTVLFPSGDLLVWSP